MVDRGAIARRFDVVVELLQSILAFLLVALLALGVADIAFIFVQPFWNGNITQPGEILGVITSSVDTVLYLLIVVELYHTIIAYVEDRDVIRAVVHAGLIAVARNIITIKPSDFETMEPSSARRARTGSSSGSTCSTRPNPARTPKTGDARLIFQRLMNQIRI